MSFFEKIVAFFTDPFGKRKKQDEWASRFRTPPAQPKNPLPLEPGNDPWRT